MAIFENFSGLDWLLFGLLFAAAVAYYFWPESTKAQAEVGVDRVTRDKASPLIALADKAADDQLFELTPMPLRVRVGPKLVAAEAGGQTLPASEVAEALWVQQRAMITRLEGELDYAQQADVSEHFAIAAPANQPAALLEKTLKDLEGVWTSARKLLKLAEGDALWHGRALVCMVSNRKLFDHVAWVTGAGLAASAPGSFTLAEDRIVQITIYATRLGGFARPLTMEVCRAAVLCTGGKNTPKWLEYGLAQWMTDQLVGKPQLGKDERPVSWTEQGPSVLEPATWAAAADDSAKLETLMIQSGVLVEHLMTRSPDRVLNELRTVEKAQIAGFGWVSQELPDKMIASKS